MLNLTKNSNDIKYYGKFDPDGLASTCKKGAACNSLEWISTTSSTSDVDNMTTTEKELYCWMSNSGGASSNVGAYSSATGTIDGCNADNANYDYYDSFTYVYSQAECDADGVTCPFTHRGYETAVKIDLKDDVGSSDLVVGQSQGVTGKDNKPDASLFNILRKSFITESGKAALAEFNCKLKDDGTIGECYATVYYQVGSGVTSTGACNRYFKNVNAIFTVKTKVVDKRGYVGNQYNCYRTDPFALGPGAKTWVSGTYSNRGYFEGWAMKQSDGSITETLTWFEGENLALNPNVRNKPAVYQGSVVLNLTKNSNDIKYYGKFDPDGLASTCKKGAACNSLEWISTTSSTSDVDNMTTTEKELYCWMSNSGGASSNVGAYSSATGTIDGCNADNANYDYYDSFTYVYSQAECDADGVTCPFTHRGYETAVKIDLKDDVGSSDLVVGQSQGVTGKDNKPDASLFNILRKSFITESGKAALAEFNCKLKDDGTIGECYATVYYQVGSGVTSTGACKRYFAVAKQANGAGVKVSDGIGGIPAGLMGVAVATLVFSILGCIKTAAIFNKIVMAGRSRMSMANPAFEMHRPSKV